jgi:cytochrome c peroxidase
MKMKFLVIGSILLFCFAAGFIPADTNTAGKKAATIILTEKDELERKVVELTKALNTGAFGQASHPDTIRARLLACRLAYKQMEWALSYFYPSLATRINGVDFMEEEEPMEFEPAHGLQVIENLALQPTARDSLQNRRLKDELNRLRVTINHLNEAISLLSGASDGELLASLKYEIIKISLQGFTEYDNPVMKNYLNESLAALIGVKEILLLFRERVSPALSSKTNKVFQSAEYCIHKCKKPESFNRLQFLTKQYPALSGLVDEYAAELKTEYRSYNPCVNLKTKSIFDLESFEYYFKDAEPNTKQARVDLGKDLFFDPVLSGNSKRSCASCHNPEKCFTDGLPKSEAFEPGQFVGRNAPTLINSCLQISFFDDSRQASLEGQVGEVVNNPREFHSGFALIIERLEQSREYSVLFQKAFPEESITANNIKKAIADYERTLTGFNSDYDKYMRGDKEALTPSQINGFNLFMGKAKCGSCHFPPLFNGMLPPLYNKSEFEIIGTTQTNDFAHPLLDEDEGVGQVKNATHLSHGFKVPGLRNVALTGPYMHNGSLKTLAEVLAFYNKGGGEGLGLTVLNQTLSRDSLGLSQQQMNDIVHFLETLTDTVGLAPSRPVLPKLVSGEKLNTRISGGEY